MMILGFCTLFFVKQTCEKLQFPDWLLNGAWINNTQNFHSLFIPLLLLIENQKRFY